MFISLSLIVPQQFISAFILTYLIVRQFLVVLERSFVVVLGRKQSHKMMNYSDYDSDDYASNEDEDYVPSGKRGV